MVAVLAAENISRNSGEKQFVKVRKPFVALRGGSQQFDIVRGSSLTFAIFRGTSKKFVVVGCN